MITYTTPTPNLIATLWGPLEEMVTPLLDDAPDIADPDTRELLAALGDALTAAVRVTRAIPAAPAAVRPAAVRAPAARVTTAQVGSVAGEPKPGSLRARLINHLAAHPGQAFTATELFHALGATSGGAVGAALNTMTAHGEALLVSESPKRYSAPTTTTAPTAPPADTAHPHDGAHQDDAPAETAETTPGTDTAPEAAPTAEADANTDAPEPDADDTPTGNAADQATPQAADPPAPRTARGRKTKP